MIDQDQPTPQKGTESPKAMKGNAVVFVGFDSAWTDSEKAPGAICSIAFDGQEFVQFRSPELMGFEQALAYIKALQRPDAATIVALDQPTIVPNATGMRPVEMVAGDLLRWLGGGVISANRSKKRMFCDDAPIWKFLRRLSADEMPELARTAISGLHLIEVFPALAIPSLDDKFFGFRKAPRYNPGRPTFRLEAWNNVVRAALNEAAKFECGPLVSWLYGIDPLEQPVKADQDRLDAAICLLIAIRWRMGTRQESALLGDIRSGYMVTPVSAAVMDRLSWAGKRYDVNVD